MRIDCYFYFKCARDARIITLLPNLLALTAVAILLSGCASPPLRENDARIQAIRLRQQLVSLDDSVDAGEASTLAGTALQKSADLAREYRAVRPAWFHNVLVNWGLRQRGLCYEWTNDLFPVLSALNSRSLKLHLAVARMDTPHEHNSIIVTARQQSFREGVVLDAWRHSGRLWFGPVATDKKYPWQPLPRDRVPPELEKIVSEHLTDP